MFKDMISIIVPIYNAEKSLRECIESVIYQNYSNIELILIDDGSIDRSYEICKEYENKDRRIKVYHQSNLGVSSARNKGISMANGEYIFFLDSDDRCENVLNYCVNVIKKENVDLLIGGTDYYKNNKFLISEKANLFGEEYKIYSGNGKDKLNRWIMERNITDFPELLVSGKKTIRIGGVIAKLIKKKSIGNLKFIEKLGYSEDLVFMYELLKKIDRLAVLSKPIYRYNYREDSATNSEYNPRIVEFNRELSKYIYKISTEYDDMYENSMYEKILEIYWSSVVQGIAYNPNNKFYEKVHKISDEFKYYSYILKKLKINNVRKQKNKFILFLCKHNMNICILLLSYIRKIKGE